MITQTTGYCHGIGGRLWWKSITQPNDAVPIILLHGGPGIPSYYLESLEVLAGDRQVVVYDQLGCGRSDIPTDPTLWAVDTFVEDLDILANDRGLEKFHLLGHSWGGLLALAYSHRHPERVSTLVLASPLVSVVAWCEDADRMVRQLPPGLQEALRRPDDSEAYREAEQEFYRRHFCCLDPWPASLQRSVDELSPGPYQTMWGPNEFTQTGNLRGVDLTPVVRSLTIPNLWLCGSEDEATPETIRAFAEMNPYSEYVEFAGGTHSAHLEQPDEFIAAVRRFLAHPPIAAKATVASDPTKEQT